MGQEMCDEIIEAANCIKLVGRMVASMELNDVELGTCAMILDHATLAICKAVEGLEAISG